MKQVLVAGHHLPLYATAARYNSISGGHYWTGIERYYQQCMPTGGKLKSLRVSLDGSPGVGKSYTFTLRVNGVDSALAVTISDTETGGSDTINEVDVVAGDLVSLKCVPAGTPSARSSRWTLIFEGATSGESIVLGVSLSGSTGTRYSPISQGYPSNIISPESAAQQVCPTSGKLKKLYVNLSLAPGGGGSYTCTLRVNQGNTTLACTITDPATTGSDIANEVAVSVGDVLTLGMVPTGPPTESPVLGFGMVFAADTDGESIILGETYDWLDPTATEYNYLCMGSVYPAVVWDPTESKRYQLAQRAQAVSCILKKLYVLLDGSPGAGKSYTFTLRKNSADTALVVTISGAGVSGKDVANKVAISDDDLVNLQVAPSGTPSATLWSYWGIVSVWEPLAVATNAAIDINPISAILNGSLDDDGGEACDVRFQWGKTEDYGNDTPWQAGFHTGDTFNLLINTLEPGTLYHFRAQAKNSLGTISAEDVSFWTPKPSLGKGYAFSRELHIKRTIDAVDEASIAASGITTLADCRGINLIEVPSSLTLTVEATYDATATQGIKIHVRTSLTNHALGTHTGADGAAALTDAEAHFVVNELIGLTIKNLTDGSSGAITANTATGVTATLVGGTDNDWDTGDAYIIEGAGYDTEDWDSFTPAFGAGSSIRQTEHYDVDPVYLKVLVENLDGAKAVTDVKIIMAVGT